MSPIYASRYTAFAGDRLVGRGSYAEIAQALRAAGDLAAPVLVFDDADARPVEFDLRGDLAAVLARLAPAEPVEKRGPGRPKLGVTAREVTLLPRHWDWLAAQPGGASVALRKLVEDARKVSVDDDRRRAAQEAAYRFMQAIAGDQAGYEDAARALFAGDIGKFEEHSATWPDDVREHAALLAADAFHH